jgi:hypothetical protein
MARRGRLIGIALGLLVIFMVITTRKSGSHPRDLHTSRSQDSETHGELYPIIKEPPGRWDTVGDKFRDQQGRDGSEKNMQDHLDAISKQGLDSADEGIQRKPLRKADQNSKNLKEQVEVEKEPKREQDGVGRSGAVVIEKEEVVRQYDPAEGMSDASLF